jgi:rod shape-determining protein MreD
MRNILIRLGIIFLAVLIQISFFPALFSAAHAPNLILLLVISWAIIVGFNDILIWIIITGIISDLVFFKSVGTSVIFFVIVAYGISFLSRRFLVENRNWGFLMMSFFVFAATIFYGLFNVFINSQFIESLNGSFWTELFIFRKEIAMQVVLNLLFFPLCYFPLVKLERRLSFHDKKMSLK